MKKYYLLMLLVCGMLNAQVVNIPNANFKNKLLGATLSNDTAKDISGANMIIDANSNGQIEVAEALNVYQLSVKNASITSLQGIQAFTNLTDLNCSSNGLSALDLSSNIALKTVNCNFNNIAVLNITGLSQIKNLSCHGNELTNINVANLSELQILGISSNNLTTLDCTQNHNLSGLYISGNNLETLFIKNGSDESVDIDTGSWWEGWNGNPSLTYVCADENEVASILTFVGDDVVVSSYCSFTPGGNYNTIVGKTYIDVDNNGCSVADASPAYMKVTINDGLDSGSTFTDSNGEYKFYVQSGNFTLTAQIENSSYFVVNPIATTISLPTVNNSTTIQDFCLIPNGTHQDLEIVIAPITPARPGFEAVYEIVYRNKGNTVMTLDYGVTFFYNNNLMSFVSADVTPSTIGPGGLSWNYSSLKPFESRSILVTMQINPPTDLVNPVNIGDILTFNSTISPIGPDEVQIDNYGIFNQTVVGSFDPNDIQCVEGGVVDSAQIGKYLHYAIRFENTGTAEAENIVVKTEINPADFDINSLQLLSASHPIFARVKNNVVEFILKDIMLDSGGHGNILLKIKSKSELTVGDAVSKKADIFFDYNFPVLTNIAETVFQNLSVGDVNDISFSIYPNPVNDIFSVKASSTIKSIQLFDVQGRILITSQVSRNETELNISNYPDGMYFIKIITERGAATQKVIKK